MDELYSFKPFNKQQAVRVYRRNLPHWQQAGCTYFVTFRTADSIPRKVLEDALVFHHGKQFACGDYVIMPNHVHWLVLPLFDFDLEKILNSIKRFVSTQFGKRFGQTGKLWQRENFDRIVRDAEELNRIRDYIQNNPKKAGLHRGAYAYSRSAWL